MIKYLGIYSFLVFLSVQTENVNLKNEAMSRILNGKVVDIADRPYQVAIFNKINSKIVCGGALVKPKVVFTAAHCTHVSEFSPRDNLLVLTGANSIKDPEGKIHKIQKVIKHPDFSFNSFDNDFSVVILKKAVEFNPKSQIIPISLKDHSEGTRATASGWGVTEFGLPSTKLKTVQLTIERHSKCQYYFPKIYHPRITSNMICVKPEKGSTYYGDSGGPLVVDGDLVGLVSFGKTVHGSKKITVFTKVKNYLDFANDVIFEHIQK